MTVKIAELEEQARALEKSVDGGGEKAEQKEETPLSVAHKALDLLKACLPERLRKAAFAGEETEEEEEEEEHRFARKSGETKQPHGDQNTLNSGEMSSSKKVPKKFNYDAKMEDTDVDYPDNSEVPYYEEKRNVHKSLSDIQNDPDLSDEDKVFVVNDYLEKGFARMARMEKAVEAIAYAQSVQLKLMTKSLEQQAAAGNTGRGRVTMLSAVDKPGAINKSVVGNGNGENGMTRLEISQKLLKAQKAGIINYQTVALAEECMNGNPQLGLAPGLPPAHIMKAIENC